MKTLKTTILKTKYALVALLVAFSFSCSPEDGAAGPIGPAGANGADGVAGTDGNANVQTLTIDATTFAGTFDNVSIPEITQDVLDNDAIISYLADAGTNWVAIPCPFDTYQFDFSVHVTLNVGSIDLDYGDASGTGFSITAGDLQTLKVIIIESTSTTAKVSNNKQQVYNELAQAGINIKDYYAVCDYYGIAY